MLTSQAPNSLAQNQQQWTKWAPIHPEIKKNYHSTLVFRDKILLVGGLLKPDPYTNRQSKALNLVLIDPTSQKFQIIKSTGSDLNELCWPSASACYWKDSKIVVFGGWDFGPTGRRSDLAIVTLKDLDSETPSAQWERFHSTAQFYSDSPSAYINQNQMLVLNGQTKAILRSLNLDDGSWGKIFTTLDDSSTSIFHESKAYFVSHYLHPNITINVFDFDTQTWDKIIGPGIPDVKDHIVCSQLVDGKIYLGIGRTYHGRLPKAELHSFDISSKTWTEILSSNHPLFDKKALLLFVNNHLILYGKENGVFWSFPLSESDSSKPSEVLIKSSSNLSNTQQSMLDFLKEAPYSDISFEVESQEIKAHKWWLCKKSKYFANMFASGMVEAQASRIKITDMTAPTFQAFLEFLYVDHVELNNTLALELLQQADKFSVPQLAKACEKHLAENLAPENYVVVSQMAEMLDIVLLREAVVNYIAKNMKQLKTRKDFEDISDTLLRESIVKFIVK